VSCQKQNKSHGITFKTKKVMFHIDAKSSACQFRI